MTSKADDAYKKAIAPAWEAYEKARGMEYLTNIRMIVRPKGGTLWN